MLYEIYYKYRLGSQRFEYKIGGDGTNEKMEKILWIL